MGETADDLATSGDRGDFAVPLFLGFLGVLAFSFTLPAPRVSPSRISIRRSSASGAQRSPRFPPR